MLANVSRKKSADSGSLITPVCPHVQVVGAIRYKRANGQLDGEYKQLLGKLLRLHPDYYSMWNFRKEAVLAEVREKQGRKEIRKKKSHAGVTGQEGGRGIKVDGRDGEKDGFGGVRRTIRGIMTRRQQVTSGPPRDREKTVRGLHLTGEISGSQRKAEATTL